MTKIANSQQNLTILLLGTGGTIAGLLRDDLEAKQSGAYSSAQLPIEALIPASRHRIIPEQIAQIDSKDMSFEVWEKLHIRISEAQNDASIDAIVITHGTDTMEETAYFLHRTLEAKKPVMLTGAMRPADAADSDGPRNMKFAFEQAQHLAAGVWVAFAGRVFASGNVQKVHPTRLDAFDVIDADHRGNAPQPLPRLALRLPINRWPRVEMVMSYAGADGAEVEALMAQKVDGIVVAGTGDSTIHADLQAKLDKACEAGIAVGYTSRCQAGRIVQARIDLILKIIGDRP